MSVLTLAAMLLPSAVLYGVLRRLSTGAPTQVSRALAAAIAPGLGLGLASCLYFFLLLADLRSAAILRVDAGIWVGIVLVIGADAWFRRRTAQPDEASSSARSDRVALAVAAAGAAALIVLAVTAFWTHRSLRPHGEWDAWAIWNLRARAILRGAPDWGAVFSPALAWSNVDYPVLLPLSIARLWAYQGAETTMVPALVAFVFLASTVAAVAVLVGQMRGWVSGLLSAAVLLAPHTYVFQSSCQCADVPLATYLLIAVACAAIARSSRETGCVLMAAAGAAAGLAAWTKNEGQMLFLLIAISVLGWPRGTKLRSWLWFGAGSAVPLAALASFKLRLSPHNYLFAPEAVAWLRERLFDASRWTLIRTQMTELLPAWGELPGGALIILVAAVAMTLRLDRRSTARFVYGLSVIVLMMFGDLVVYAITPLPLSWQILTSFQRLVTQLWPALVWALFQLSGAALSEKRRVPLERGAAPFSPTI